MHDEDEDEDENEDEDEDEDDNPEPWETIPHSLMEPIIICLNSAPNMSSQAEPTQLGQPSFHNNQNGEIQKNEIGYILHLNALPTETEEGKLSRFHERLLGRHPY